MEIFPRNQFLIVKSEDLFATPETTVNEVFEFLGVESYQLPQYPQVNQGKYPPISESIRQTMNDYFRPFNQQLEEYLDRKFNWYC
ncbi:MAG: sulfotransferase domain-containing protein [Okeania sp. SIO2F4]|nr:sulfotransferase domain-containing protein [Okeania sp. SIO2F4]